MRNIKESILKNKMLTAILYVILYFIFICVIDINTLISNYITIIGATVIGILIAIVAFLTIKKYKKIKKIDYKKIIITIIIIGIILRTVYILYTPITERQHDVNVSFGHLTVIEIIYLTGKLPDASFGLVFQQYQQPLHHIISAGWLAFSDIYGLDLETAEENIQILTAAYSTITMLITFCILKELNIKDKYKVIAMIIVAVHPTFIILSGSINNDCLLVMFIMWTLLYLIKWHKDSSYKNTIILALLTACTALTKISGTIIAIPIMYVFIDKVIREFLKQNKNPKIIRKYIFKFIVFGVIALGLGLSYSIRNKILFGQDLFYVPSGSEDQYCGDKSLLERLNIFSAEWKSIFTDPFTDCNMIVFLIKSSLFGEYSVEGCNALAAIMIVLNIAVIIVSLISLVKVLIKQRKNDQIIVNMFAIFYIVQLIVYLYGNLQMPYGSSMDIRYIVPNITIGALFIALNMNEEKHLKINKAIIALIIFWTIACIIFELTYMQGLSINLQ